MYDLLPSVQKLVRRPGFFPLGKKSFASEFDPHCLVIYNKEDDVEAPGINTPDAAGGYTLEVTKKSINICANDYAGLFYGTRTLNQLTEGFGRVPCVKITDYPDLALRAVHLDLKGNLPKFDRMKKIIENLGEYKLNAILLEYEDKFPYKKHPKIVSPLALKPEEIEELKNVAEYNAVQIIPLVQCAGHVEYILKHSKYSRLMEDRRFLNEFCLTDKRALQVYKDLALEVLETHKEAKYFHIGGDEAWHRGSCPACKKAAGRRGKDKFYIDYVSGICDFVNQNGKTPVVWDDCFRKASPAELKKISSKAVLMYWKYGTTTEGKEEVQYPSLQLYKKTGVRLAGASAVSGADGMNATCVNHKRRLENNLSWARVAKKYHMLGVAGTAWTRYCGTLPPAEAIETAWMPVLAEAEFLWKVPAGNNFNDYSRRFVKRFYGIDSDELVKAHYLIDKSNQKAFEAREIFKKFKSKAKKNREILGLMEVSCEIIELNEHFKYVIETIIESDWYRNRHYVLWKQEKKDKLLELAEAKKIITGIKRRALEVYSKFLKKAEAEEFVLSRFALEEKKIDEYSIFLRKTKAK